jgi:quercetin dioxygenase-like cupin family protein
MHINQVGDLELLLNAIGQRGPQPAPTDDCHCSADTILDPCRTLYRNRNSALAIDFCVQRLPLEGLQVMDPRLVRIAPGASNECHRHAHESIFVVLAGEADLLLGQQSVHLKVGNVACVPRWVVHQSRNRSMEEELLLLAITDFGLTSTVLGDYDRRTRVAPLRVV